MSMTVRTKIKGATNLDLMMQALQALDIEARTAGAKETVRGRQVVAVARIQGHKVGLVRGKNRELTLIGDSDWKVMKNRNFTSRLQQQYGVAAVKKKVTEMNYRIDTITTQENGAIRIVARAGR